MSLLDEITGGSDENAQNAEQEALNAYSGVTAPTSSQLTIPQLQQYIDTGDLTPATATAATVNPDTNAFDDIQLDPTSLGSEYQTLAELQNVVNDNGADAEEQLQEQQALDTSNSALQGQRGAIEQLAEARGVAPGLAAMSQEEQDAGEDSASLFSADQTAAAAQEARQLAALSDVGTLGGQIEQQVYQPESSAATAANAIQQFNAANQQQTNLTNTANKEAADVYDTTTKQGVENANVGQNNAATVYNSTEAPQTAYEDALQKAAGTTTAANDLATQQTAQGQQSAGLASGILGAGAQIGAAALQNGAIPAATGGEVVNMDDGGIIPGKPKVAGDSQLNDFVPGEIGKNGPKIRVSPGEVILPRTVAAHPEKIPQFLRTLPRYNPALKNPNKVHPEDVATILRSLGHLRNGGQQ